jgi:hypothetical protein
MAKAMAHQAELMDPDLAIQLIRRQRSRKLVLVLAVFVACLVGGSIAVYMAYTHTADAPGYHDGYN